MFPDTLVIGGTRNLGPDLVRALVARGDRVTVLHRGLTHAALPDGVTSLHADRTDPAALRAALGTRSFDHVVDTTLYAGADARAVVALLAGRAGRYVFWSTGQVYLVRTGIAPPFTESMYDGPLMPEPAKSNVVDHENWLYGIGKRDAEDALRTAPVPCTSLRFPMITSRRDHYERLAAYVRRIEDGGPIMVPDDQPSLRLRHVSGDDVVAATLRALDPSVPAGLHVNVTQDETMTLDGMLAIIGDAMEATPRVHAVPRALLEERGLLPACSPWSGRWMSVLDNRLGKELLGIRYAGPAAYLPPLVRALMERKDAGIAGMSRRAVEIELARR